MSKLVSRIRTARRVWLVWGLLTSVGVIPLLLIGAVVIMAAMTAGLPVVAVTDSVARYPGGVWADEQLHKAVGRDDEVTVDEVRDVRAELDRELGDDPALARCFRGAPEVRPVQETLFVASVEERNAIIEYRDAKLRYNAQLEDYLRRHAQWERVMQDYTRRVRIARARNYRPDQIPAPPPEPQRPPRPPELPAKSYELTAAERGGVSASADIDPALISVETAAVPANTPLRDEKGRTTPAVNEVIDSVPQGTAAPVARLYLTVAFAGGVTGWNHFKAIMDTSGLTSIHDGQVDAVALSFFAPGVDLAPYAKAVDAALISLIVEKQVDGDIRRALRTFSECA